MNKNLFKGKKGFKKTQNIDLILNLEMSPF